MYESKCEDDLGMASMTMSMSPGSPRERSLAVESVTFPPILLAIAMRDERGRGHTDKSFLLVKRRDLLWALKFRWKLPPRQKLILSLLLSRYRW